MFQNLMMKRIFLLVIVALTLSLFGCDKKVAEGDGWKITDKEFKEKISFLPPDAASYMVTEEGQKRFIETLVLRKILYTEAEKEGITKDKRILNKIDDAQRKVVIEEYLEKKFKDQLPLTRKEIEELYERNKDSFDNASTIWARHILVETKEEAEGILKMLEAGEDFTAMAKEYSIGPSAPRGGDLGYFGKNDMVPEFDTAAFALKIPGDISGIVKTRYGFHIIKLVDKDRLLEKFQAQKKKMLLDKYIADLKENSEYTIYEENLSLKKDIKKEKVKDEGDIIEDEKVEDEKEEVEVEE